MVIPTHLKTMENHGSPLRTWKRGTDCTVYENNNKENINSRFQNKAPTETYIATHDYSDYVDVFSSLSSSFFVVCV